jgi:flagellar biosynthesis/type III secretory pathway chaperone
MQTTWESDLAELLTELSATQTDLLDVLGRKRKFLVASDLDGLASLQDREQELITRLEACHVRRGKLLERAAGQGLPSDSIRSLASSQTGTERKELSQQITDASRRARLLQNQGLTNWVIAQRTLLHLSQLLEIIATGGRARPTYGKSDTGRPHGSLVDQAA